MFESHQFTTSLCHRFTPKDAKNLILTIYFLAIFSVLAVKKNQNELNFGLDFIHSFYQKFDSSITFPFGDRQWWRYAECRRMKKKPVDDDTIP